MITDIRYQRKTLHFHEPFAIAYEQVDSADMLIIRMSDNDGHHGYGCASPDHEVTGESLVDVEGCLRTALTPALFSEPWDEWYRHHLTIQEAFAGFPCLQSAVEEAFLSLMCNRKGLNLGDLFGGYRPSAPIMVTIGIRDESATAASARQRVADGFRCLKLKCGLDAEADISRVKAVRAAVPNDIDIVIDANQGYTLEDARKVAKGLKGVGVSLFEQPVDARDLEGLKSLCREAAVPIVADESVVSAADALKLLSGGYADGVNIKIMKCGGPLQFIRIFHIARTLGKMIMLGCMYESNISMTTGAHLASALPIDFVDLDSGPLDFRDDIVTGGAYVQAGNIYPGGLLKATDL